METKANYTLIGGFVILIIFSLLLFILWISKIDWQDDKKTYLIHFSGSVTGLRVGESVRFHGIPIGSVKKIAPNKDDPEIITVKVTIDLPELIRDDSVATLEAQGLTGFTYVQIEGGSKQSPKLHVKQDQKYPVIASKPSRIEELFRSMPKIVSNLSELSSRFNRIFNDDTIESLSQTFKHLAQLTQDMGDGPESVKTFIQDIKQTLKKFNTTLDQAQAQINPISQEVSHTLKALRSTSQKLEKTAQDLGGFINESSPDLQEGLADFTHLVQDARYLMSRLNKVIQSLEQSPAHFLNTTPQQGYKIP